MTSSFSQDILQGLTARPKKLPTAYFYDENGDRLFQQLLRSPEYYLTRSESEIFTTNRDKLIEYFGKQSFHLVDIGPGAGEKILGLLRELLQRKASFIYRPVDVSATLLDRLTRSLRTALPGLRAEETCTDYLHFPRFGNGGKRHVIFFSGSNIGRLTEEETVSFLSRVNASLKPAKRRQPGDLLVIGFDLKKNPEMILHAHKDRQDIMKAFHLNLLRRINRELAANFDLNAFSYHVSYDPVTGEVDTYLISRWTQTVTINALKASFDLKAWEPIHIDRTRKYELSDIDRLARASGFSTIAQLQDEKGYFVEAVWEAHEGPLEK